MRVTLHTKVENSTSPSASSVLPELWLCSPELIDFPIRSFRGKARFGQARCLVMAVANCHTKRCYITEVGILTTDYYVLMSEPADLDTGCGLLYLAA